MLVLVAAALFYQMLSRYLIKKYIFQRSPGHFHPSTTTGEKKKKWKSLLLLFYVRFSVSEDFYFVCVCVCACACLGFWLFVFFFCAGKVKVFSVCGLLSW